MAFRSPHLAAELHLLLVALLWGAQFPLVKTVMAITTPANFMAIRFSMAVLLLIPVAWAKRASWSNKVLWPGVLAGLFLFGVFITQTYGLVFTSASRSGFITGLNVILVPLLTILIFRKMPGKFALIGSGLAFGGLYLLSAADKTQGLPFNIGDVLTIGCAFLCAGHLLVLNWYSPRHDSFWLTMLQLLVVLAGSLIWAGLAGELTIQLPGRTLGIGLFLAVTCTIYAFWAMTWAQARTTATRTAIIFALEPVFAALFAWWWLAERLGPIGLAGGGLILFGIVLAEVRPQLRDIQVPPS